MSNNISVLEALEGSERVLWICAHPDDENSSGGLVARARDVAGRLYMASLTRGENSDIVWGGLRRGSEIGEVRAGLFAQSASLFQAEEYDIGPFVNGPHSLKHLDGLPVDAEYRDWPGRETHSDDVIAKWKGEGDPIAYIVGLLRRWQPDTVISMDDWCGVSGHDEHMAVARLLLDAIPTASEAGAYRDEGKPWRVRNVIFSAHIIKPLIDIGLAKCEGDEPREPIEHILSLDESQTHSSTYFRVACRVAKSYQNVMQEKGWSDEEVEAECADIEARARQAHEQGATQYPLLEPYRLRPV